MPKKDTAAKKAARTRQRQIGEPYTRVRHNTSLGHLRLFIDDCCANCL